MERRGGWGRLVRRGDAARLEARRESGGRGDAGARAEAAYSTGRRRQGRRRGESVAGAEGASSTPTRVSWTQHGNERGRGKPALL